MKRILREYTVRSKFDFGFFEGHTIERVFTGVASCNPDLLKAGILWELKHNGLPNLGDILQVVRINGRIAFIFKKININGEIFEQIQLPEFEIDSWSFRYIYCIENKSSVKDEDTYHLVHTLGHPGYIMWAIKNVKWFCLSEGTIMSLQSREFVSKIVFKNYQSNGAIYSIPSFENAKFKIPPDLLKENQEKRSRINDAFS